MIATLALTFAGLWVGCSTDSTPDETVPEVCGNGADDDGDGATDCNDSDCLASCPELCGNALDDDADGNTDCADSDCDGSCVEDCADARDNDGDGQADCDDKDCNLPACVEDCGDNRDNDGDAAIDCSDTDCNIESCDELCTDARDNDGDAAVDCDDEDCDGLCPEDCADGRDNDLDAFIDCDDPECEASCPEDCSDGADNDADALIDCVDPECLGTCDADADGFLNGDNGGDDCDDLDAAVNPDALETCNGWDDDCDTLIDLDDPDVDPLSLVRFYMDDDGDGFGDRLGGGVWACVGDPGLVDNDTDCNDNDPAINPTAFEVCDDQDNDCDSLVDDADPSVDLSTAPTWWIDADGDGWGSPGASIVSCHKPPGYADNDVDCDDGDPILGGALVDWYEDNDTDGFGAGAIVETACFPSDPSFVYEIGDCDDDDDLIHPDAAEPCDLVDNDCDTLFDWDDDSHQCVINGSGLGATVGQINPFNLDAVTSDFGTATAANGVFLAVGVADGNEGDAGVVLLYENIGGTWTISRSFDSGLAPALDGFGSSVALDDNNLLVVGAPDAGTGGLVYAWLRDPASGVWNAVPSWEPPDVGVADGVGASVAADGGTIWVGVPGDDAAGNDAGAVYALSFDGVSWNEEDLFEGLGAFQALGTVVDGSGLQGVSTAPGTDELCFLDAVLHDMACESGTFGAVDAAMEGNRVAAAAPGTVDVWTKIGPLSWTLTTSLLPAVAALPGFAASVDFDGDLIAAGAPDEEAPSTFVWKDIGGTWVNAAQILGSSGLPSDVLDVTGPSSYPAGNCIPFGDGFIFGDFMGFVYKDMPAFDLAPGDTIAFDLYAKNDVDIEMNVAIAHTTVNGGTAEDFTGFLPIASGTPTTPRGNLVSYDYELAWVAEFPVSFPGGGLIVRFEPTGGYALDMNCTPVITATNSADPSGNFVWRFYSDPDGKSPWAGGDSFVIGIMRITSSSSPSFGTNLSVSNDEVFIGAPGSAFDGTMGELSSTLPTGFDAAW